MPGLRAWLTQPVVVRLARWIVGVVFVAAGLAKMGDLRAFAEQIHNFRMAPVAAENLLAMTLPWIELLAGLAMILGIRARAASAVTALLMAVFTLAVLQALLRGLDIECGCFGTADASRVGLFKLAQNIGLTVLALVATAAPGEAASSRSREGAPTRRADVASEI